MPESIVKAAIIRKVVKKKKKRKKTFIDILKEYKIENDKEKEEVEKAKETEEIKEKNEVGDNGDDPGTLRAYLEVELARLSTRSGQDQDETE